MDLHSLALHELGHLLGLEHISPDDDASSVMSRTLSRGIEGMQRIPSAGDRARVRWLYGLGPKPPKLLSPAAGGVIINPSPSDEGGDKPPPHPREEC